MLLAFCLGVLSHALYQTLWFQVVREEIFHRNYNANTQIVNKMIAKLWFIPSWAYIAVPLQTSISLPVDAVS